MQQKAFEDSPSPWPESLENVAVCLPFRCPRCGDHTRFRSLSSLRAHLEFRHSYEERGLGPACSLFSPLRDADLIAASEPPRPGRPGRPGSGGRAVRHRAGYVNLGHLAREGPRDRKALQLVAERPAPRVPVYASADSLGRPRAGAGLPSAEAKASFEAHVRAKLDRVVEAVDRTVEKRIDKLARELAQKTAELLEVRAAFVQLTQRKQEVQRRERALNRQVDVAVEMIAVLRQRLSESEEELLRKEEEVVTFNHFLEAAAEKEVQGKARLQNFIENLLQRVDLAEKQLEYYQSQQVSGHSKGTSEHLFTDIASNRKSKCLCRGGPHLACHNPDLKAHFHPKGRNSLKKAKDERGCMQSARFAHDLADSPRELWRPLKKGEPLGPVRKVNVKAKMVKKKPPAIVHII